MNVKTCITKYIIRELDEIKASTTAEGDITEI